jgi:large subunit ribosomal protein L22
MATVEAPRTSVRAVAKYVRTAPRKAQLVADQIRGRSVPEARTILRFMTRDAARDVEKVLRSAAANAEANHGLDSDELVVATVEIGAGPTLKRWKARARGRVGRIKKRTCHISITLELPGGAVIPDAPVAPPVEEKPKRSPRKKAAPEAPAVDTPAEAGETVEERAAAEPAVAVEETPAVVDDEPAPARPKRAPRKKPGADEAPAPDAPVDPEAGAPAAEEKPKRAPRRKPAAAAETTGDAEAAAEKPKRAPRKRKTEETEGSEES